MNNAAASLSYFVIIQSQLLANLGLTLAMLIVVVIMVSKKMFVFGESRNTDGGEAALNLVPTRLGEHGGA